MPRTPLSLLRRGRLGLLLLLGLGASGCQSAEPASGEVGTRSVFVVRHAQALKNLDPRPELPPEQLDALTELGREQARALAEELRDRGITRILCSPTGRTTQTADILAATLGVEVQATDALKSLAGGVDEEGVAVPFSWRVEGWEAGVDRRPLGGENLEDGIRRALAGILDAEEGSIVVVTHGDIAAGLIGHALGTAVPECWSRHEIPTAGCQEVELRSGPGSTSGSSASGSSTSGS